MKTEKLPIVIPKPLIGYQQLAMHAYIEMLRLKNYSEHTIRSYRNWFIFFLNHFPGRKPSEINKNEIMDFLVYPVGIK